MGLEVTFKAKPIHGVAGSGGHTHVGASVKLKEWKNRKYICTKRYEKRLFK